MFGNLGIPTQRGGGFFPETNQSIHSIFQIVYCISWKTEPYIFLSSSITHYTNDIECVSTGVC